MLDRNPAVSWVDENKRSLTAAIDEVRAYVESYVAGRTCAETPTGSPVGIGAPLPSSPSALHTLTTLFGLSAFERSVLVLCAAVELDASIAELCALAHDNASKAYPTFGLALAALPVAHWSALNPDAPLRYWRLVETNAGAAALMTTAPLRIDERVLHYLTGVNYLDERLRVSVRAAAPGSPIPPTHSVVGQRLSDVLSHPGDVFPAVQLCGPDDGAKRDIASNACASLHVNLFVAAADCIPANGCDFEEFVRLWDREAGLTRSALYVDAEMTDRSDQRQVAVVSRLIDRVRGPVILSARERWRNLQRSIVALDVDKPTLEEQRTIWASSLGTATRGADAHAESLVVHFNLSAATIRAAAIQAQLACQDGSDLGGQLWAAAQAQARPRLDDLAQRIASRATWSDLVLPADERSLLADLTAHIAHRRTVYETWGFGSKIDRGLGVSVLFAGASGTGKTMAAEVLANEFRLDLYRIDLSSVVSKYIGDTEKNLRRVFDAAEEGGALLFFDEADALFGKRSEVKDSRDRYANIEINYLLTRMEAYRGVAILATNLKGSLDKAFLRRIRFVVNFPFPDAAMRAEIWRRAFPPEAPVTGVDIPTLARLELVGGSIRNVALGAAFLAASECRPISMAHLQRAVRVEFAKLERPLDESGIASWR